MVQAAEKQPNMAFLEYLAELVEVNGELVGPLDFKAVPAKTQDNEIDSGHIKDEQVKANKPSSTKPDEDKAGSKVKTNPSNNTIKSNNKEDEINA